MSEQEELCSWCEGICGEGEPCPGFAAAMADARQTPPLGRVVGGEDVAFWLALDRAIRTAREESR